MGYRHEAKMYRLVFEQYPGLEVMAKSVSTGKLMKLTRMAVRLSERDDDQPLTAQDADAVEALFEGFAKALVSWNLEDENGDPVPATRDGVDDQEFDFMLAIINAWIETVAGVPDELGKGSRSGRQFPEVSIPMEMLSPSPSS